jgi:uncharacterized protein YycO
MRLSAYRHLLTRTNSLDFGSLEPGDIVLCANPRDVFALRAVLFWSHAGMYTGLGEARAFVDAVNLPVRGGARGKLIWRKVRFSSLAMYRGYVDVVALRVDCPPEARRAAAAFAVAQVGKPFARGLCVSFLNRRRDDNSFTCTSLVWRAYLEQGIDLAPAWLCRRVLPWPSALAAHQRVRVVGVGTRLRPIPRRRAYLPLIIQRCWFARILRKTLAPPRLDAEAPRAGAGARPAGCPPPEDVE